MYWLSDDNGNELANYYYLKDARKSAQKIATTSHIDVYINKGENIIDVIFAK